MDSELLKTFLEVSRTRHFGRAAEALYLTQSAVSFRIRQLETQLGVNLFTRHRNNIRLTAAGERLLPYAESLMDTWLAAKKEVSMAAQHSQFSIGASAALWESMLTPWIANIYQQHFAKYDVRIAPRQTLVKQLHERNLDLLLTTEPPKMDEFESRLLGHFDLALYQSLRATNDPQNIPSTYLRIEWGADFQQYENTLIKGEEIPVLTTSSATMACQLLDQLNAFTFLPINWASRQSGITERPNSMPLSRPLYAIWLQNTDKLNIIDALLNVPLQPAETD